MNPRLHAFRTISIACLATLAFPAFAVEPPADFAAVGRWVVDSANCNAEFLDGLQDRKFIERLKSLGITFQTDWQEGDIPEGEFTTPQPIRIAGQPATHFRYWGDSGAEFYAIVAAPAETVAKAADARPLAARWKNDFDARTVGLRFTRAPEGETLAPAIFVRRAETGGDTEVGCRLFDG